MNLSFQNYFKGKKTQATDKKKMSNFLLDKKIKRQIKHVEKIYWNY